MEREIPLELGLHAGLHVNAAVEGMAEEEGLHLLAGAAFDHAPAADVARGEGGGAEPCGGGEVNMEQQVQEGHVLDSGEGPSCADDRNKQEKKESLKEAAVLSRLTVNLMSRPRLETVYWQELQDEFQRGDMHLQYKYSFEQLKTHWLEPWEDMECAIKAFAKLALRPDCSYRITKTVTITSCAYIIGNGAIVEVDTSDRVAFRCRMQGMGPGVVGLDGITFINVRFAGDKFKGIMFEANTCLVLHGVYFLNFSNICVESWNKVSARGCTFYGCWKGLVGRPKSKLSVKKCLFEKCVLALIVEGDAHIRHNAASENACFVLLKGMAILKHNMVCGVSDQTMRRFVTCADGNCHTLKTVHIVSHSRHCWPVCDHNMFMRCTIHLGLRRGMFRPSQCNFSHSNIMLEPEVFSRVCLNGVFDLSVELCKVIRYNDDTRHRCRQCECGSSHLELRPIVLNVTEELRSDHLTLSCLRTDYESSDEDDN
ncbi:control protein E1B 55K [Human adenovirus 12]|uniref:E1B 55 kDa protein n=1 Tax=Human adenovirus A serotype 12 TaxID=28282 RepID=A0A3G8W3C0_ADE12|nr:control protein E1B 55K [Human adenovirus 12]